MKHPDRNAIRLANDIRDQLLVLRQRQALDWSECLRYARARLEPLLALQRQLGLCRDRRFYAATKRLRDRSVLLLPDLIGEIEGLQRIDQRPKAVVPSLRDLVEEIHQIQDEFDGYEYDRKGHTLSVTTEPIELEGIELGPFRVHLHLSKLVDLGNNREVYDVEALEPHPAATDSGVTHPHVSHGRLCEGDASAPIRAALLEGRVCDCFLLVRSVLQTYNPHSPYVSLDNWEGRPCADCGYTIVGDGSYYCEACDQDFCESCISYCRRCDRSLCRSCLVECPHCQELYCDRCMETCSECRQACCPSCLEDGLCPPCKEDQERNEREQQEREDAEESALNAHSLD